MGDEVDLEGIVLDFRFTEIEAELFVVLQHLESVERQLPHVAQIERERLEEEELSGVDDYDEARAIGGWIDTFIEEVLPRLYRAPMLIELWAVFESGIIEVAEYLQKQQGLLISVKDLRANNDFERAQKYYDRVIQFPLISSDDVKERLEMLVSVRNCVAHCNGRIEAIKPHLLSKLRQWEKKHGGISTDGDYLGFTAPFVQSMADGVKTSLEDLIKRAKEKY